MLRPPEDGAPFDHTTIIATLHKLFDLGPPPEARARQAPDLLSALRLERPPNSGPACIDATETRPTRDEMHFHQRRRSNKYQRRLLWPGSLLAAAAAKAAAHTHRARRNRFPLRGEAGA